MLKGIYKKIGICLFVFLIFFSYSIEYSHAQNTKEDAAIAELRLQYLEYAKSLEEAKAQDPKNFGFWTSKEETIEGLTIKQNRVSAKLEEALGPSALQSFKEGKTPATMTGVWFANSSGIDTDPNGVNKTDTYTKIDGTENSYRSSNPNFKDQIFTIQLSKTTGKYEITSTKNGNTIRNFGSTDATRAQQQVEDGPEIICVSGILTIQNAFNPLCYIAKLSYYIVFNFSSLFLSISGQLFNFVVVQTVVQMNELIRDDIVEQGWVLFRDIINILFIFVLIYAAIRTILKGTSDTGKTVVTVIVVAVLINFSLFFTKVIIDISNTLAISFYNSITEIPLKDAAGRPITVTNKTQYGIAEVFLTQTNMTTVVGTNSANIKWGVASLTYLGIIKQTLIASVFIVILGVVLLLMSLMLVARFLILMFVMITSSLAFGSYILPKLQSKVADKWWPALIGQAFFVPVFFLMLYITLKFSQTLSFDKGEGFADIAHIVPGQIVTYVLVVGMLILSMKVAKSMADEAGAASGKITGLLGATALGVTGFAARTVLGGAVGKGLQALAGDNDKWYGRATRAMGEKFSTSSWDIRSSKKFENLNKAFGGVDVGDAGGKGGYDKWREESVINAVAPTDKVKEKEVKEHEKKYKDAGKFEGDKKMKGADGKETNYTEQEAVNISEERKKYNNEIAKLQKQKKEIDQNDQEAQEAIQKQIDKKQEKLDKHKHEHGNDIEVSERREAAEDAAKKRQAEFLDSRNSAAGKEFAKQQRAKNAKEKTDVDKLLEGLKAQSGGGGGGKPAEGDGDKK